MKIAIIISGQFNLFELSLQNLLNKFNKLNEHYIDFFFNIESQIILKHPDKSILIDIVTDLKDIFFNLEYFKNLNNIENLIKIGNNNWYEIILDINNEYIEELIKKNFKNIKYLLVKKTPVNIQNNNLHDLFFETESYKKHEIINEYLKSEGEIYDKYIVLRPDYIFYDNMNLSKYLNKNDFIIHNLYRLDFFYIGNKYLPDLINDKIKKDYKNNKINYTSFEKYIPNLFEKLNIKYQVNYLSNKIDINSIYCLDQVKIYIEKSKKYILLNNSYDNYYNSQFKNNDYINQYYLKIEKNSENTLFSFLKKRDQLIKKIINDNNILTIFKKNNFKKLFENFKNVEVYYNKKDINYDNIIENINYGGIIPLKNLLDLDNRKFFYSRIGLVELKIIKHYLFNYENLKNKFNLLKKKLLNHNDNSIYQLKTDNIEHDLIKFTTNAGFYITNEENNFEILEFFVKKYIDGYKNSTALLRCDNCMEFMKSLNLEIKENITIYIEKDIYELMNNKNVLIVSPFANQINHQKISNNFFKFYNDPIFEKYNFNFFAIETPITIFGNPVHNSWKDTYLNIIDKIKNYTNNNKIDFFMAACGSYSIPFCDYVYTKLNIPSLCFGNAIHQLFGIIQNDSYCFKKHLIDEKYCIKIDKNIINNEKLFENMSKIDAECGFKGGKYLKS